MSDPANLGLGDWVMKLVGGLLVALGVGGVTMFSNAIHNAKAKIDTRLTRLEDWHHDKVTQLTALQICQQNTADKLEAIDIVTRDTNMKLDNLIQVMLKKE